MWNVSKMIGLMMVMLMVFLRCGELVLVKVEELVLFPGLSMELRDKIMSLWSREVKWQQGCI